jgi:hypothetical protein
MDWWNSLVCVDDGVDLGSVFTRSVCMLARKQKENVGTRARTHQRVEQEASVDAAVQQQ